MDKMIQHCTAMMQGMMNGGMMGTMMGGGMMNGMMGTMMWAMLVGFLLLAVLIILGGILLVRIVGSGTAGSKSEPLRILQERFARGEIDREEYQERLSVLRERRFS